MAKVHGRAVSALLLFAPLAAAGADIAVIGLFTGKAIVQVDGGRPRTVSVGESTPDGVRLISANSEAAVIEYGGRRETLSLGHGTRLGPGSADAGTGQTLLTADGRGHFLTIGTVNGQAVRFLVDTGASAIVMSAAEARRIGVNYIAAPRSAMQTANGVVAAYRVKLDTVKVGAITAHNVDAVVSEAELPVVLLGMSFLNRTDMRREGDVMKLTRRY